MGSILSRVYQPDTALNPERRFLLHHVGFDKTIVRAEGNYLIDQDGVRYLDALAQYGALPFGHNPPAIWDRLDEVHRSSEPSFVQPLLNAGAEDLGRRLLCLLPHMNRVTFVNSGAEATEVAIKLARARTQRRRIVTVERGFHGKTNAALCATANLRYREPFFVDEAHFSCIPFGDLAALESILAQHDTAALILEPLQGEGGMRLQPAGFLAAAQVLCRKYGALFVLDEVQTGLGRTGEMFGFQHHGAIEADIVLLAKALGGGLVPIGAVLCTEESWTEAFGMLHSSTFANSHLSAVVGCATLAMLESGDRALIRNARQCGAMLQEGLEALAAKYPAAIADVRGQGLMHGIELRAWSGATSYFNAHASHCGYAVPIVAGYLLNHQHVLTAPTFNHGNVLRVQPPLTITAAEIGVLLAALDTTAAHIQNEDFIELFGTLVPSPRLPRRQRSRLVPAATAPRIDAGTGVRKRRFAFLIHPTDEDALFGILPASFQSLDDETRRSWLDWLNSWSSKMHEAAPVLHVESVPSLAGADVEGWLIATSLTPEQMIRMGAQAREYVLSQYIAEARKLDVDIVGLGAFTSVISQGGALVADAGLNVTTGNSLTALASATTLLRYAALRSDDIEREAFAVIGAAGSVGRLVAFHLAHNGARRLRLIGNAANQRALGALRSVAGEIVFDIACHGTADDEFGMARAMRQLGKAALAELRAFTPQRDEDFAAVYDAFVAHCIRAGMDECPISVTTNVVEGVRTSKFVLTATSAGRSFIKSDSFMEGAVVCDVARPLDVLHRMNGLRDDLVVYEGGLVSLPTGLRFGDQNVLGYPSGVNLACLSETIVLAMEGATRSHSLGNRIDYREALAILSKAETHGFVPYMDPSVVAAFATPTVEIAALKFDTELDVLTIER